MLDKDKIELSDPIEVLIGEHWKGLSEVEKIRDAAQSIQKNGFTAEAFRQLADATRYIGSEMRRHYDKEEKYLFPLLDKHVFESPNVVRHERREMWQNFNELIMAIKDIEEGRIHGTIIRELLQSAIKLVELFRNHIERENNLIFPMVKRMLTTEEYAQLRKEIGSLVYR